MIYLRLSFSFFSFRWQSGGVDPSKNLETWRGVLNSRLWLLAQDNDKLYFKSISDTPCEKEFDDDESVLKDYFQLNIGNLGKLLNTK